MNPTLAAAHGNKEVVSDLNIGLVLRDFVCAYDVDRLGLVAFGLMDATHCDGTGMPEVVGITLAVSVPDIFRLRLCWTWKLRTCDRSRMGTTNGGVLGV